MGKTQCLSLYSSIELWQSLNCARHCPGMYTLLSLALHSGSEPDNCPMKGEKWNASAVMDYRMKEGRKVERDDIASCVPVN